VSDVIWIKLKFIWRICIKKRLWCSCCWK